MAGMEEGKADVRFESVDAAQEWSTKHGKHIYVEIEGAEGVLEVYPGGRKIFLSADRGKVYQRWRRRLTPDPEFHQESKP